MNKIVITRHQGLVDYLIEKKIVNEGVEVLDHATPKNVRGRHVVGVLPHSLSCLTASFTEVPLFLPAELRGKELSVEQVRKYAQPAVTYVIRRV